jgi:hypothetical protein
MDVRSLVAATAAVMLVGGGARPSVAEFQSAPEPAITLRMLTATSRESAERLLVRLAAGESFVTLATTESTAPTAAEGGWLGRLPLSQLRPEIRQAINGLQPGQITGVVQLPTGFAIFRVEADEPPTSSGSVGAAIASTGAVKYVYDVSGFTDARISLESLPKAAGWNLDPEETCEARDAAIATARASAEAYLAPANAWARAGRDPLDLMQMVVALGQLAAFEGRMDLAITRFREATALATASVPAAAAQMEEALGLAHFHKAGLDNGIFAHPGDFCLLSLAPGRPYPKPQDASTAITHFERYLSTRPDDLEVRWFLNLAYMATGGYPDRVPRHQLIPPSVFAGSVDVGRFHDVAEAAGIVNVESAGGIIVDDFRGTGQFDIVTSTSDKCRPARFHVNNGNGTFTDRTEAAGLARQLGGLNTVQGDFNNDGCPDVLILRGGWEELPQRRSLLRNNCDGTFTDITVASGLGAPTTSQTAVWFDFDNDGWLDVFIGNENMRAQLFRNRGNGTFEDVAGASGVDRVAFTKGVVAADYDNDRDADLFVSNYGGSNFLYRNNGNGTFTDVATAARVLGTPQGFAAWFFDYDNDGWQDLFVTSYVASIDDMVRDLLGQSHHGTTMKLYRNQQDGTFRDVTIDAGLNRVLMPMGSNFGDLDNDGFLDMYLGTGNPSYGALQGSVLLQNVEGRRFVDVTASSGTGELHRGHGVAFADMDGDGDQDIVFQVGGVTVGDRHALRLFENPGHGNDWLALKLVGQTSNRSAVGARLAVTVVDAAGRARTIHRVVTAGGSFGGNPLAQHVGLGRGATRVDVEVWWPTTNRRQRFDDVGRNQWWRIDELMDRATPLPRSPVVLGGPGRRQG